MSNPRLPAPITRFLAAEIKAAGGREVNFACEVDAEGGIDTVRVLARGTADRVLALPGVFEPGQMMLHNHPNGVLEPSQADLHVAASLADMGVGFGIINNDGDELYVGADGRYRMALLLAPGTYGDGCQVLGPIEARACTLEGGEPGDAHDVASRGALLKGAGRAAGITLARGQVVNGAGDFRRARVEEQVAYHPARGERLGR